MTLHTSSTELPTLLVGGMGRGREGREGERFLLVAIGPSFRRPRYSEPAESDRDPNFVSLRVTVEIRKVSQAFAAVPQPVRSRDVGLQTREMPPRYSNGVRLSRP